MKNYSVLFLLLVMASSCKKEKCKETIFCPSKNSDFFYKKGADSAHVSIANAISPNGDGINDKLYTNEYGAFSTYNVYDEGRLVYHSTGFPDYWDGTDNGKIYEKVYTVKLTGFAFDTIFQINGTVSILPKVLQGIPDAKFDGNAIWKSENEQFPYQFDYDGIFDPNRPNYENIVQTLYKSCK